MANKVWLGWQLYRHFRAGWVWYRGKYALRQKLGLVERKLPAQNWSQQPLSQFLTDPSLAKHPKQYADYRREKMPAFFFHPNDQATYRPLFAQWDDPILINPILTANALIAGTLSYFSQPPMPIETPPQWHRHPLTGQKLPSDRHWSRLSEFAYGDIKWVWELNRFGFTYDLVRAYWRTGEEGYPALFWQLVEDWREQNPPQQGANWKCGQETSLRVMAWLFGLYGFAHSATTTPERMTYMAQMVAVSGQRIEENIEYAISQQNNHGISEGMGLLTIGLLFPEFLAATRWQRRGQEVLEQLGRELISADGAFSQHSFNYQRLMLHCYSWSIRLAALHGQPFSQLLLERIGAASHFLYQLQEEQSGEMPRYGQNDGAFVLPWDNSPYENYRSVVQLAGYVSKGQRTYGSGVWDEGLLWLGGVEALDAPFSPLVRRSWQAPIGGYQTVRGEKSWLFVRCGSLSYRPGQADMLHLDLWWRGQNVAIDAGTFSYNAAPPWNNPLAATRYHNTVTVDGQEQMERAGRFLWFPWVQGVVESHHPSPEQPTYWQGSHNGYDYLHVCYQRGILRLDAESWLIQDRLTSAKVHSYRLHWLLADFPHHWQPENGQLLLQTPHGDYYVTILSYHWRAEKAEWQPIKGQLSLVRGDAQSPRGWYAPRYSYRQPALSLDCTVQAQQILFLTQFTPHPISHSLLQPTQAPSSFLISNF